MSDLRGCNRKVAGSSGGFLCGSDENYIVKDASGAVYSVQKTFDRAFP